MGEGKQSACTKRSAYGPVGRVARRETLATSFRLWMSTEWLCLSKIWPFQLSTSCVSGKMRNNSSLSRNNNRWFVVGEYCHATYIKSSASVWPYFLLDLYQLVHTLIKYH